MRLIYTSKNRQIFLFLLILAAILRIYWRLKTAADPEKIDAYITLIVVAVSAFLFITEIFSLSVTAMCVPLVLTLTGVITPDEAFLGFSNENVILFASMFIIGGALFKTGVTEWIGNTVVNLTKGNERLLLAGIAVSVCCISAFLSNTGTVAVLLPVCVGIADSVGWSRKNVLLVLAMTASTGGMISLVGTPPNITVNAVLSQAGYEPFGFFEFAWIGIPLSVLGSLYLVLTRKTTPPLREATGEAVKLDNSPAMKRKRLIAVLVMVAVVVVMASSIISLHIAAALGALVCVLFGLLTEEEVVESIDWTTIFLFAGTLILADALDSTGAGRMIADTVIAGVGTNNSQFVLLTVLFLLTGILTQFMSNTAICALLAPIGLQIAAGLGADPRGALMVVGIAASSAFITPMATPPNTLVMGPGRLTMKDYIKTGLPLFVISYLITIAVVPRVWPLY